MNKIQIHIICIALATASLLTSCTSSGLKPVEAKNEVGYHQLTRPYSKANKDGLIHLSCTDQIDGKSAYEAFKNDAYKSKTGLTRIELAKRYYAHAAMSNNVYRTTETKPIFAIPHWNYLARFESTSGLCLDDYGNGKTYDSSSEIVVAFRGTDLGSLRDWATNFSITEPDQHKEAYAHVSNLRTKYPKARFTVTGHSLGGAIALNMSLRLKGVEAIAFNSSPRAFWGLTSALPNKRAHLYETGEGLNLLFGPWLRIRLPQDTAYGNYNFLDYRWRTLSPVPEHGIYELTRGLILIAMVNGNPDAKEMFRANIKKDDARKDWENCGCIFDPTNVKSHDIN